MLQYMMDLVAYVAADSLQIFFICNFIIFIVFVSSLKTTDQAAHQQHTHCLQIQPLVTVTSNIWEDEDTDCGTELVSFSVKEVPITDDHKLRTLSDARQVQDHPTFEDMLALVEVPRCDSIENNNGLLRLEEASFLKENNSNEIFEHSEEDEQFRKRVEAFISKMNSGLRDEMMQATTTALIVCT